MWRSRNGATLLTLSVTRQAQLLAQQATALTAPAAARAFLPSAWRGLAANAAADLSGTAGSGDQNQQGPWLTWRRGGALLLLTGGAAAAALGLGMGTTAGNPPPPAGANSAGSSGGGNSSGRLGSGPPSASARIVAAAPLERTVAAAGRGGAAALPAPAGGEGVRPQAAAIVAAAGQGGREQAERREAAGAAERPAAEQPPREQQQELEEEGEAAEAGYGECVGAQPCQMHGMREAADGACSRRLVLGGGGMLNQDKQIEAVALTQHTRTHMVCLAVAFTWFRRPCVYGCACVFVACREAFVRLPGEGPNPFTHPDPGQERDAAGAHVRASVRACVFGVHAREGSARCGRSCACADAPS